MKVIRSKIDGYIFDYNPYLAERIDMEVVELPDKVQMQTQPATKVKPKVTGNKVGLSPDVVFAE